VIRRLHHFRRLLARLHGGYREARERLHHGGRIKRAGHRRWHRLYHRCRLRYRHRHISWLAVYRRVIDVWIRTRHHVLGRHTHLGLGRTNGDHRAREQNASEKATNQPSHSFYNALATLDVAFERAQNTRGARERGLIRAAQRAKLGRKACDAQLATALHQGRARRGRPRPRRAGVAGIWFAPHECVLLQSSEALPRGARRC